MSGERPENVPLIPEKAPLETSNNPFAFVMVSHPSAGPDAGVLSQVRSHAALHWREESRRSRLRRGGPRRVEQRGNNVPGESQRSYSLNDTFRALPASLPVDGDLESTWRPTSATPFGASTDTTLTLRSPSPGSSPVTYLGGGRMDPFNSCAVRCNTMESFLLDHYFQTFAAKVSAIYTPRESAELHLKGIPREWVSFLITDAGVLSGVFLRACRTLSSVTSKQYLEKLALKYRARCIKALSSKIASTNTALSTESIAMMLMLTTDEFYLGTADTMRYHVDAMRRVVALKGGLEDTPLDGVILRLIDWNDAQCTILANLRGQPRQYPAVDILTSGFPTLS
ncbi:hypothetical protein B0J14DRAFT_330760 [Halenospora varia]|nr:hypothetical protein B0J14DRAFT_330760 [Halenospora varia]